jgi:hypothetical protein
MAGEHVEKVKFAEHATHQFTPHHGNVEKHLPKALPIVDGYLAYAENQRQDNVTHGQDGAVQDIVQLQELSNNMPVGQANGFVQMPMPDPNDPEQKKSIQEHLQVLEQSQELKELNRITGELEKKLDDTKIRTKNPNSISADEFFRLEEKAKVIYDQHRAITTDVDNIAANTGIPREIRAYLKTN